MCYNHYLWVVPICCQISYLLSISYIIWMHINFLYYWSWRRRKSVSQPYNEQCEIMDWPNSMSKNWEISAGNLNCYNKYGLDRSIFNSIIVRGINSGDTSCASTNIQPYFKIMYDAYSHYTYYINMF